MPKRQVLENLVSRFANFKSGFSKLFLYFLSSKTLIWSVCVLWSLSAILIICADKVIEKATNDLVFNEVDSIPFNNVGLLLGTSKFLKSGQPNQYFENRLAATVILFNAGKINYVVISGDNSKKTYNEPLDMKNELVKRGIPEEKIYLDYAGFRTYDSVYRIKEIFRQTHFTIISQEFHNRRAIYIAKALDLTAYGFNAKDVNVYNGFKTKVREMFARVKVLIDIAVNKKPKFLGEPIEIK
jgi:SanA protein